MITSLSYKGRKVEILKREPWLPYLPCYRAFIDEKAAGSWHWNEWSAIHKAKRLIDAEAPVDLGTTNDFMSKETPSFATMSVKNRMKVGDLINHHGFLGIVTGKEDGYFSFETMYNGKPNGESFVFSYDSMSEKDPKTCWVTEQ